MLTVLWQSSQPALVEDMSDGDWFSPGLDTQHAQLTLELVDVDVTTLQMTHSAVQLERMASVHHASVVEADDVARLQSYLLSGGRTVQ